MGASVVRKLPKPAAATLRSELLAAGFDDADPPAYAEFALRGPGANVVYYTSGKLVVQGKGAEDFAAAYLSPAGPLGEAPVAAHDRVEEPTIGSDESGKGDYFGPLVVAAVLVRPEDVPVLAELGVRDSKTVGDREALDIAEKIAAAWPVAVVSVSPDRYNELHTKFGRNLNKLLAWAHATAIEELLEKHTCHRAVVDRFAAERVVLAALKERGRTLKVEQRVRAESHPAVAAASIVARAHFLRRLARLGAQAGTKLPKGAGWPVDAAAREIFGRGGIDALRTVAKLHFKTTDKARGGGDAGSDDSD